MRIPGISVVIATYNHGRFIGEALQSVLAQTCPPAEVIVIDDGSTDGTEGMLTPWRNFIRYVRQDNRGLFPARNRGLAESRGAFVAFLDADDAWEPNAIEKLASVLARDPSLGIAASAFRPIDERGRPVGIIQYKRSLGIAVTTKTLLITDADVPGCVYRRAALKDAGGFAENNRWAGDYEMWLRLSVRWGIVVLPEPLLRKREHGENMSIHVDLTLADKIAAVERFVDAHPEFATKNWPLCRRAQSKNYERLAKWCLRNPRKDHAELLRASLASAIALNPIRPELRWLATRVWAHRLRHPEPPNSP